ncbi:MAG: DEAD/DEAH box helicase [Zetaproteobacteria bacterium]|nr:DEAD/DEAH box helicase [Zetaproteobacteria bacterium]
MTDHHDTPPPFGLWMGVLGNPEKSAKKGESDAYPANVKQRLLYILEPTKGHQVVVKFFTTRILKNGQFGKLLPYKPTNVTNYAPAKFILAADIRILKHVTEEMTFFADEGYPLRNEDGLKLLRRMLATERCYWVNKNSLPLKIGSKRAAIWEWEQDEQGTQLLTLDTGAADVHLIPTSPPWYVDANKRECGRVDSGQPPEIAEILLNLPPLAAGFSQDQLDHVLAMLPENIPQPIEIDCAYKEVQAKAVLLLRSVLYGGQNRGGEKWVHVAELFLSYNGIEIPYTPSRQDTLRRAEDGCVFDFKRDKAAEVEALKVLKAFHFVAMDAEQRLDAGLSPSCFVLDERHEWTAWMLQQLPEIEFHGMQVRVAEDFFYHIEEAAMWELDAKHEGLMGRPNFSVMLQSGVEIDLIEALGRWVANNPEVLREDQLQGLRQQETIAIALPGSGFLPVPGNMVANILHYMLDIFASEQPQEAMVSAPQMLALEESLKGSGNQIEVVVRTGDWMQKMQQLQSIHEMPSVTVPQQLHAQLRDYQHDGLNWMQLMRSLNLNGILADDMGLGKTVQAVTHILKEKEEGRLDLPVLVVAPTSLMHNWRREIATFAPSLKVHVSHGSDRAKHFENLTDFDVILTTYPLIVRDAEYLFANRYHLLILDEAQYIKNARSKAAQMVRCVETRHKICLTGTPMENHLGELWSQFDFLMPGYLYDQNQFADLFRKPIENMGDAARQQALRVRVRPFVLRRTKEQVASELPEKTEMVRSIEMESDQRELYDSVRLAMQKRVRDALDTLGAEKSHIVVLDALLKMRQVCCDPRLLQSQQEQSTVSSAKMQMLRDMIPEMVAEGRRILLFSQFAGMLRLIEQEMQALNINYVMLTGQTKDRATPVDKFQNGEVPIFLISLKAGGVGLNLTAADTVIHFDPWWNPAAESQATDRAHRIGQDKPVFVYKLIIEGSVEEKILEMQARKKDLMQGVFEQQGQKGGPLWSMAEMEQLFLPMGDVD